MKKELYNRLSAEIRKLVPRTMELSFGCKIVGSHDNPELKYVGFSNGQHSALVENKEVSTLIFFNQIDNREIISHPLTLEDVLEAIDGRRLNFEIGDREWYGLTVEWQYGTPLQNQSQTLGEFLENILLKKADNGI